MLKRNFYIFLSSVIAIVAVLGWIGPQTDADIFGIFADDRSEAEQVGTALEFEGKAVAELYAAADVLALSELSALVTGASLQAFLKEALPTQPHIRLFDPDTAPKLDSAIVVVDKLAQARAALSEMQQSESLSGAKLVAIADLEGGEVLAASDAELAQRVLMKLRTKERASEDVLYQLEDDQLMRVSWHCVGLDKRRCLLTLADARLVVEGEFACRLTSENYALNCEALTGDGAIIESSDAFLATECPEQTPELEPELRAAVRRDVVNSAEDTGQIELGEKTFHYNKHEVNTACTLIALRTSDEASMAVVLPPASESTPSGGGSPEGMGLYNPLTIIIAVLVALFMAVLGLLLLRPSCSEQIKLGKTAEDEHRKALEHLNNERIRLASERDRLKVQIADLEARLSVMEEKNKRLRDDIEALELRCQALETDKTELLKSFSHQPETSRIDDGYDTASSESSELSAVPKVSRTVLDDHLLSGKSDASNERQTEELPVVNIDDILLKVEDEDIDGQSLPTSELNSADIAAVKSAEHPSIHDYFPDDGWDEIAASFDAIINESKVAAKSGSLEPKVALLENEPNPEESVFGMTSFLESVRDSDQRVTQERSLQNKGSETPIGLSTMQSAQKFSSIPQKGLTSQTSKGFPKLPTMPTSAGSSDALNDSKLPKRPVSGLNKSIKAEREITETAASLATKKSASSESGGFKPAPSWTGHRAQDNVGLDQSSLLDALKRRTRDVSEIQDAVADPSRPQGFDYKRSLSKSGVFSMTGSRVDIKPISDTETFKALYERFVESQQETGEVGDRFTLEQFVNRLAREKEQLMKTYHCKDVRFQVYVKDGKTSLKATPVK